MAARPFAGGTGAGATQATDACKTVRLGEEHVLDDNLPKRNLFLYQAQKRLKEFLEWQFH